MSVGAVYVNSKSFRASPFEKTTATNFAESGVALIVYDPSVVISAGVEEGPKPASEIVVSLYAILPLIFVGLPLATVNMAV